MDGSQGSQGSQGSCLSLSGWLYLLLVRHCSWYYWSLISPRSSLSPVTWQQKRLPKSLAWRKFELEVSVSRDSLHEDYSHNFSFTGLTYQHGMVLPQLISSQPFNLIKFFPFSPNFLFPSSTYRTQCSRRPYSITPEIPRLWLGCCDPVWAGDRVIWMLLLFPELGGEEMWPWWGPEDNCYNIFTTAQSLQRLV